MKAVLLAALFAVLAVLLAGCGGGGGSETPSPFTPPPGANLLVTLVDEEGANQPVDPAYLGFQDGDGAWQRVTLSGGGQYGFTVTDAAGRYGLAIASAYTGGDDLYVVRVMHATLNEMRVVTCPVFGHAYAGGRITAAGAFAGYDADHLGAIYAGSAGENLLFPDANYSFTVPATVGAAVDLAATRIDLTTSEIGPRFVLERGIAPGALASRAVDLNGVASFTLAHYLPVDTGALPGATFTGCYLLTKNGTRVDLGSPLAAPRRFPVLPPGKRVAGDRYLVTLEGDLGGGTFAAYRMLGDLTSDPADPPAVVASALQSFDAPAAASSVVNGVLRVATTWTAHPDAAVQAYEIAATQNDLTWCAAVSAGWLAGRANELTFPVLPGLGAHYLYYTDVDFPGRGLSLTGSVLLGNGALGDAVNLQFKTRCLDAVPTALPAGAQAGFVNSPPAILGSALMTRGRRR